MGQAAVLLTMLATVGATLAATRMARDDGLLLIVGVAGIAVGVLALLGGDLETSSSALAPLLLIIGYACLAGLLKQAGVTQSLAGKLGDKPLPVFVLAAGLSALLSNDIVIVTLAPVVLLRKNVLVDAAALYVGANVTGGLLLQGSPTNIILFNDASFLEYLQTSAPLTLAMALPAIIVFWLIGKFGWGIKQNQEEPTSTEGLTQTQKTLLAITVATILLQPVSDLLGIPKSVYGWLLLVGAAVGAKVLGYKTGTIVSKAPWEIAAVVLVLTMGAGLLARQDILQENATLGAGLTFFVASLGTDILAATLAAASESVGSVEALVAVTAGAFATPIASISGILLLEQYQTAAKKPQPATFVLAGGVAVCSLLAGVLVAMLL